CALGLASVNVATTAVKLDPEAGGFTVWPVTVSGASVTVAVVSAVTVLPPVSVITTPTLNEPAWEVGVPGTSKPGPLDVTDPVEVCPSPQWIVAVNSEASPLGLPSLNEATTVVNSEPSTARMAALVVELVTVSGASTTFAVGCAVRTVAPAASLTVTVR